MMFLGGKPKRQRNATGYRASAAHECEKERVKERMYQRDSAAWSRNGCSCSCGQELPFRVVLNSCIWMSGRWNPTPEVGWVSRILAASSSCLPHGITHHHEKLHCGIIGQKVKLAVIFGSLYACLQWRWQGHKRVWILGKSSCFSFCAYYKSSTTMKYLFRRRCYALYTRYIEWLYIEPTLLVALDNIGPIYKIMALNAYRKNIFQPFYRIY